MEKTMHGHRCLIIILWLLFFADLAYAQFTASQIANKYSSSVITIVTLDKNDKPLSFGSGFFINTTGDIVTNHHVLAGSSKAIIRTKKGEEGNILEIIKDDPELDLLVARTSLKNAAPVPLGNSDAITIGEDIVVIGNPAGLEGTVSKGIISGIRESEGIKIIQITAPISPGSSGGPVFNLSSKVIGITTALLKFGQNLNFAMPSNYLNSIKPVRIKLDSLPRKETKERTTEEDRWKSYYKTDELRIFYDNESILRKGQIVHVWTKDIPISRERYILERMEWQKEEKKKDSSHVVVDYSSYEYTLRLNVIDCGERKWYQPRIISCGTNDQVISEYNENIDSWKRINRDYWHHIKPLSQMEKLYKAVCQ